MAWRYVESRSFSACVGTRTGAKGVGWRALSREWWETQRHRHKLFISPELVRELSANDLLNRKPALRMLTGLTLLGLSREADLLTVVPRFDGIKTAAEMP